MWVSKKRGVVPTKAISFGIICIAAYSISKCKDVDGMVISRIPKWFCAWIRMRVLFWRLLDAQSTVLGGLTLLFTNPKLLYRFFSPPCEAIFGIDYAKDLKLDVFSPTNYFERPRVVVFIHGGIWTLGNRFMYRLMGLRFASEGYTCVIPSMNLHPYSDAKEQAKQVQEAISWAKKTFNTANIVAMGHSSGAHVTALATCTKMAFKEKMPDGIFLCNGVYHIADHYQHESMRGVETISPMEIACGGKENFDNVSPTLFPHIQNDNLHITLFHGKEDHVVPIYQSENFFNAIVSNTKRLEIDPDGTHADWLLNFMKGKETSVLSYLCEMFDDIQGRQLLSITVTPPRSDDEV